jgi:dipeptidyl aminopeptidase/acylaminoacyl peptidase
MRLRFLIFAALLLFAFPALAQPKHPFTFEDMMKLKRVGEPEVSPDGKWVIFSVVDVISKPIRRRRTSGSCLTAAEVRSVSSET